MGGKIMNVYDIITNRIIETLNHGEIPWKKSWNAATQAQKAADCIMNRTTIAA